MKKNPIRQFQTIISAAIETTTVMSIFAIFESQVVLSGTVVVWLFGGPVEFGVIGVGGTTAGQQIV